MEIVVIYKKVKINIELRNNKSKVYIVVSNIICKFFTIIF